MASREALRKWSTKSRLLAIPLAILITGLGAGIGLTIYLGFLQHGHLNAGIGLALALVFSALLVVILLCLAYRWWSTRHAFTTDLSDEEHGIIDPGSSRMDRTQSLISFLRTGPERSPMRSEKKAAATSWPISNDALAMLRPALNAPLKSRTQYEIKIGNKERVKAFHLKRSRTVSDKCVSHQKVCRRKLSKKSLHGDRVTRSASFISPVNDGIACEKTGSERTPPSQAMTTLERFTRPVASRRKPECPGFTRSASHTVGMSLRASPPPKPLHRKSFSSGTALPRSSPAPVGPLPPLPSLSATVESSIGKDGAHRRSYTASGTETPPPVPCPAYYICPHARSDISAPAHASRWRSPPHTMAIDTEQLSQCGHWDAASVDTWRFSANLLQTDAELSLGRQNLDDTSLTNDDLQQRLSSAVTHKIKPGDGATSAYSTPARKEMTRVSANGSPEERRGAMLISDVTIDSLLSRDMTPSTKFVLNNNVELQALTPTRQPSALKGSPHARKKGHRRKNCVRISTCEPVVFESRLSQHSTLGGISEESPSGTKIAPINLTAQPRLSSRQSLSPTHFRERRKWRATLSTGSSVLQLSDFNQDVPVHQRPRFFFQSPANRVARESSALLSFGSVPSQDVIANNLGARTPTPTLEITRPSGEHDRTQEGFPFNFESPIVPKAIFDDKHLCWSPPAEDVNESDLPWPEFEASQTRLSGSIDKIGGGTLERQPSSSSVDYPYADGQLEVTCSDPVHEHGSTMSVPRPAPLAVTSRRSSIDRKPPASNAQFPWTTSPWPPNTAKLSPLGAHPPLVTSGSPFSITSPTPSRRTNTSRQSTAIFSPTRTIRPLSALVVTKTDTNSWNDDETVVSDRPSALSFVSGPRNQPPQNLLRSIMRLRRMDSDLKAAGAHSRGSRRYRNLGRDDSLGLPFDYARFSIFSDDTEEDGRSLISDLENLGLGGGDLHGRTSAENGEDDGANDVTGDLRDDSDDDQENWGSFDFKFAFPLPAPAGASPVSSIPRIPPGQSATAANKASGSGRMALSEIELPERSNSVWELGERHWNDVGAGVENTQSVSGSSRGTGAIKGPKTTRMNSVQRRDLLQKASTLSMTPELTPIPAFRKHMSSGHGGPATVLATPMSLYDVQGFLK